MIEKIKNNKNLFQVILFALFSGIAGFLQTVSRLGFDIAFKNMSQTVNIWPFGAQALGSFLAFLLSNIIGKGVSYITNRKGTFKADNSKAVSILIYTALVIVLIIAETIVGTPLQNFIYTIFGGTHTGLELSTLTAQNGVWYQISGIISQALYGTVDAVIIFLMDKYVIMKKA